MYGYACGGWIKEASIPPGTGRWNKFSELSWKNSEFIKKVGNCDFHFHTSKKEKENKAKQQT